MAYFYHEIKKNRLLLGLSQKQLADLVGVSRKAISDYETNKYMPALDIALRLACILVVPVDRLFYESEDFRRCQNK